VGERKQGGEEEGNEGRVRGRGDGVKVRGVGGSRRGGGNHFPFPEN